MSGFFSLLVFVLEVVRRFQQREMGDADTCSLLFAEQVYMRQAQEERQQAEAVEWDE